MIRKTAALINYVKVSNNIVKRMSSSSFLFPFLDELYDLFRGEVPTVLKVTFDDHRGIKMFSASWLI